MLCYKGGLGKGGRQQLQEVARYPSEVANHYSGPTYPSLVLPFNNIHLKTGGCSVRPLKRLQILSLSADFPLSLAFIHTLCTHSWLAFAQDPTSESTLHCSESLSSSLEGLTKLLTRLELPRVLKERTLNLLSAVVWTLCTVAPDTLTPTQLSSDLLQGLQREVVQLYEAEASKFSKSKQKSKYPPPGSIAEGGQGKFSTYFQSLLECFLATSTYRHKFHRVDPDSSLSPSSSSSSSGLPASSSFSPPPLPEPVKRSGMHRFRRRRGAAKRESSESDARKREEWLGVVRNVSQLLTSLASSLPPHSPSSPHHPSSASSEQCVQLLQNYLEASLAGSLPVHPNSRLVVVTGIRGDLSIEEARTVLRRICRSLGGLCNDQLYLPVRDVPHREREEEESRTGSEQSGSGKESLDRVEEREGEREEERGREGEELVRWTQLPVQESLTPDQSPASTEASSSPQELPQTQASLSENVRSPARQLVGHAVLELCCSSNVPALCDALRKSSSLQAPERSLTTTAVSDALMCTENETATTALEGYLRQRLVEGDTLTPSAEAALRSVCGGSEGDRGGEEGQSGSSVKREEDRDLVTEGVSGDRLLFLMGYGGAESTGGEAAEAAWREIQGDGSCATVDRFLSWCTKQAVKNPRRVWLGLFACGYDLHFTR